MIVHLILLFSFFCSFSLQGDVCEFIEMEHPETGRKIQFWGDIHSQIPKKEYASAQQVSNSISFSSSLEDTHREIDLFQEAPMNFMNIVDKKAREEYETWLKNINTNDSHTLSQLGLLSFFKYRFPFVTQTNKSIHWMCRNMRLPFVDPRVKLFEINYSLAEIDRLLLQYLTFFSEKIKKLPDGKEKECALRLYKVIERAIQEAHSIFLGYKSCGCGDTNLYTMPIKEVYEHCKNKYQENGKHLALMLCLFPLTSWQHSSDQELVKNIHTFFSRLPHLQFFPNLLSILFNNVFELDFLLAIFNSSNNSIVHVGRSHMQRLSGYLETLGWKKTPYSHSLQKNENGSIVEVNPNDFDPNDIEKYLPVPQECFERINSL